MNRLQQIPFFIFLVFIVHVASAQVDLKKLDAYYEKALNDWQIPGMSIAIVKDGKIIFEKGYGLKEQGKSDKTDAHTLYAIASNSKAFTSAVMAQLVDDGKLKWDDKVQDYLPYFQLYDPWVSSEVTIRDILSHRVGLKTFSGDLIWYRSNLSAEEMIKRVKFLPKDYDFRSGYGYANVMFITAGEVIRKVTGKSWGDVIQERLLNPLGMDRTIYNTDDLAKKGNFATPHYLAGEKHEPMQWENWNHVAATGGIVSSVHDMAQWMMFNIDNGIWKGDTLLSPASRNLLWTPHNNFVVDHTSKEKRNNFRGYGLGWFLADYRGKMIVSHTGGYSGMLSAVTLVPEEKLGVVVLTNGMKGIYGALVNYTIDAFLKAPVKDWSAERLATSKQDINDAAEQRKKARVSDTKPALSKSEIVGEYLANAYGKITVVQEGEKLKLKFEHSPTLNATLEHWHFDAYELKWDNPKELPWFGFGTVKFEAGHDGKVSGISFDVPNEDFWFDELNAKKIK